MSALQQLLQTLEERIPSANEVVLSLEEYVRMRKVYEDNKDANYRIKLEIHHVNYQQKRGESPVKISHLHTTEFSFPDDTESKLTEVFQSVHQNCKYMEYLEKEKEEALDHAEQLEARLNAADAEIERLREKLAQQSWWRRIF